MFSGYSIITGETYHINWLCHTRRYAHRHRVQHLYSLQTYSGNPVFTSLSSPRMLPLATISRYTPLQRLTDSLSLCLRSLAAQWAVSYLTGSSRPDAVAPMHIVQSLVSLQSYSGNPVFTSLCSPRMLHLATMNRYTPLQRLTDSLSLRTRPLAAQWADFYLTSSS